MNIYPICKQIISQVYLGKNLNDELSQYNNNVDIAKIRYLSFGVIRNYFYLNFIINQLNPKFDKKILIWLQIGIFELKFSHKPNYAIVNNLVELVNSPQKKFVNWLLREYLRNKENLDLKIKQDFSIYYNLPNWFINKLKQQYSNYLAILEGFNHHPAFGIRLNPQKTNLNDYSELLNQAQLEYQKIDNKICLNTPCNIQQLPFFDLGWCSIQDIGAQYLIDLLTKHHIKPSKVLDACAAPGGKTCQILENYNCELLALDINPQRLIKVKQNLQRINLNASLEVADALKWTTSQQFDLIIADVPCSATGTIKRNPDIKLTRQNNDLTKFAQQQQEIIINLWSLLSNGGHLVYITCSIFKEENQYNLEWFINNLKNCKIIDELQILPTQFNDALYYAILKKSL